IRSTFHNNLSDGIRGTNSVRFIPALPQFLPVSVYPALFLLALRNTERHSSPVALQSLTNPVACSVRFGWDQESNPGTKIPAFCLRPDVSPPSRTRFEAP
ncbi:MAG TPA: hypothetical protein VLK84_25465, partial [Longimicrobium sp.]|nr:hypothetical protein [Longimicrobium sp.]